jgi:hypothetical protein
MNVPKIISDWQALVEADAKRYAALDRDECQLCLAHGSDKRSLFIRCMYAIHEVVPEAIVMQGVLEPSDPRRDHYYLNICKACRGRLLNHLRIWREECIAVVVHRRAAPGQADCCEPERNIPVRVDGTVKMMTTAEYQEYDRLQRLPK